MANNTPSDLRVSSLLDNKHYHDLMNQISLADCRLVEQELSRELKILEKNLLNKDFAVGPTTIGSELELGLVNKDTLLPAMNNIELSNELKLNYIQTELSRFCLEYNGNVTLASQQPINNILNELRLVLAEVEEVASSKFNTLLVSIGIIPTVRIEDINYDTITQYLRYYSIDKAMGLLRNNTEFALNITGEDRVNLMFDNTVIEGINSSYQIHLRVNPRDFNNFYNAAQLASAFVLAVSGNSPLLFGNKLWEETRIAVFEQTANNHSMHIGSLAELPRVSFGRGWIKDGAFGLIKELCELYHPILPQILLGINKRQHDSLKNTTASWGPDLWYIMQHNRTVWPWNRAIYDSAYGGHFRIEMRYLPAGPTAFDMAMNAGFMLGLTKAFSKNIHSIIDNLPFKYAQYNFYQAAQYGLNAKCIFPKGDYLNKEVPVTNLYKELIALAGEGLQALGATSAEIKAMQSCMTERVLTRMTGAVWQRTIFDKLMAQHQLSKELALNKMLELYISHQKQNLPVSTWSLEI